MDIDTTTKILTATALLIGGLAALLREIREWIKAAEKKPPEEPRRAINIIVKLAKPWFVVGILLIAGAVGFTTSALLGAGDTAIYGFEAGTLGWVPQAYESDQGVVDVAQSADRAKFGRYSLKLTADLEGGHPNRSKGEAYVEIPPQNLLGRPIAAWVYVPKEALGDPRKPNGIQVFVKDGRWRAEYGTWWDITLARVDAWHQVTLVPSTSAPPDGYMAPGFDPSQVRAIGVKVAIGEGSSAKYRGPVYVDSVDWK